MSLRLIKTLNEIIRLTRYAMTVHFTGMSLCKKLLLGFGGTLSIFVLVLAALLIYIDHFAVFCTEGPVLSLKTCPTGWRIIRSSAGCNIGLECPGHLEISAN
jgi:hypothetical protein